MGSRAQSVILLAAALSRNFRYGKVARLRALLRRRDVAEHRVVADHIRIRVRGLAHGELDDLPISIRRGNVGEIRLGLAALNGGAAPGRDGVRPAAVLDLVDAGNRAWS